VTRYVTDHTMNKHHTGCEAHSAGLKMPNHVHFFQQALLTYKVGQTDLVLVSDQGSLVSLCIQDYKSLCAAVTIYGTLVNIQTNPHTQTACDQLI